MIVDTQGANALQQVQAPRADSVLFLISDVDGDGALSYPIANGASIHYWHGLQFQSQGKQYHTGFAWISPTDHGQQPADGYPDPGAQAVLAQATFVQTGSVNEPWRWEGSEPYIGVFGGDGRGNRVDSQRQQQQWPLANGDLLLAIPSSYDAAGATMRTIEVLHFSAKLPAAVDDKRWRHLGTLEVGSDNSASCGEQNPRIPCRDVIGQLQFVATPGQEFPVLSVAFPENSSETTRQYRYDARTKTYRPT